MVQGYQVKGHGNICCRSLRDWLRVWSAKFIPGPFDYTLALFVQLRSRPVPTYSFVVEKGIDVIKEPLRLRDAKIELVHFPRRNRCRPLRLQVVQNVPKSLRVRLHIPGLEAWCPFTAEANLIALR